MGLKLQLVFIFASLMTFVFVIKKIQKHGLNIDDAIMWILWSILLLIISVFPQIPTWISKQLVFMSTSNFIFCVFIFFLYILGYIFKIFNKNDIPFVILTFVMVLIGYGFISFILLIKNKRETDKLNQELSKFKERDE